MIWEVIGDLHSVHDALFHITSRLKETIFPTRPPFPNSGPRYMPPYPEMPPPPFRPRHNPGSPGSYTSPVAHFHNIDRNPPPPLDHLPAFSHGRDHIGPNFDWVPHPYGSERHEHGPMYDRPPSPRSWTPQLAVGIPGELMLVLVFLQEMRPMPGVEFMHPLQQLKL